MKTLNETINHILRSAMLLAVVMTSATAWAETITLTSETGEVTLNNGDVLTGTGGVNTRIRVVAGATVTLSGVDIYTIVNHENAVYWWPAISCLGDAVIILAEGTNNRVKSNHNDFPAVTVAYDHTLTIRGNGSLEAVSCGYGAGIGSGAGMYCGNIIIESGNITATAGYIDNQNRRWGGEAAGIGCGYSGICGNISISGGTVNATSFEAAGIGSCQLGECGNITITGGIVTATGGTFHFTIDSNSAAGIGSDYRGTCGNISINISSVGSIIAKKSVNSPYSVGPGLSDDEAVSICGTLTIDGVATDYITDEVFTYSKGIYDITYNLDGGTNASSNPAQYTIESPDITIAEPTRFGYDFVGWTYEGQSTPVKSVTIPQGSTGNLTLTANWELTPVMQLTEGFGYWELQDGQTLTGTGGANTHITIADGATVTLSGVNITYYGYDSSHFWAGITCQGDATIILADGTTNNIRGCHPESPGIFVPAGKTLTIQGRGTLNAIGGESKPAGIGGNYGWCGNIVIAGGTINATGGWTGTGIGSGEGGTCGDITITTGVTSVTVTGGYQAIGAGRWGNCGTVTIGGVVTGSISASSITYRPADNTPCTVTFNANGGTGTMSDQTMLKNIPINLNACTYTREGLAFVGWNTEAGGTGTAYTDGQAIAITGDITLYAQWREYHTVTFNANGGTGTMGTQTYVDGVQQNLNSCTFTRENYIFTGWNTEAGGTGTTYTDGQAIAVTGDITLYAQWREYHTVTFNANGGTGTMADQLFYDGATQTLSPCTFTCENHIFSGWNTEAGGTGTAYTDGQAICPSNNMTLYAQWRKYVCINLSDDTGEVTLHNGELLTGTGGENTHVTIDDGATVTLSNVDITAIFSFYQWAGITCAGDAIIILEGLNKVKGGGVSSGIFVPSGKTLTIRGSGSLEATGEDYAAGIGGNMISDCGNIIIEGGSVTATGGMDTAGIGCGFLGHCGDITITDGIISVTATGGDGADAIGKGCDSPSIGTITIAPGLTDVTEGNTRMLYHELTLANDADNSEAISAKNERTCRTVTLADRTLYKDGEWNTICLPFDVDLTAEGCPLAGAIAKTLNDSRMTTSTSVRMGFSEEPLTTLVAGRPYIIKWEKVEGEEDIENPVFHDVTIDATQRNVTIDDVVTFVGYYDALKLYPYPTADDPGDFAVADVPYIYYMTAGSVLKRTAKNRILKSCRAYFDFTPLLSHTTGGVREIILDFGDGESQGSTTTDLTNFTDITHYTDSDGAWYDLQGRRLESSIFNSKSSIRKKGLYIHGGKKVVIK